MKLQHVLVAIACSTIVFFGGLAGTASADTVDILIEQLRAKGVISEEEYQELQSQLLAVMKKRKPPRWIAKCKSLKRK